MDQKDGQLLPYTSRGSREQNAPWAKFLMGFCPVFTIEDLEHRRNWIFPFLALSSTEDRALLQENHFPGLHKAPSGYIALQAKESTYSKMQCMAAILQTCPASSFLFLYSPPRLYQGVNQSGRCIKSLSNYSIAGVLLED